MVGLKGKTKNKNKTQQHPKNHFKRRLFSSKVEFIYNSVASHLLPLCDNLSLLTPEEQTHIDMN